MISEKTISIHENDCNDNINYLNKEGCYFLISKKNRITARHQCREEFAIFFTKKTKKIWYRNEVIFLANEQTNYN